METHVVATFARRPEAREALDQINERYPWAHARLGDTDDMLDAMVLSQRAEVAEGLPVQSGVMSGPLARGALVWGSVGLVVGALIGLAAGLVVSSAGATLGGFIVFFALAGAIGASTVCAVLGAGRQAVKEGETTPEDPTAVVRADTDREHADELIAALSASGARRADFIEGPLPRPAAGDVETPHAPPRSRLARDERSTSNAGFEPDRRPGRRPR
jgi:hypothetical protein